MSVVTNLIVSLPLASERDPRRWIDRVNAFFTDERPLVYVDDPALPSHWYGGSKYLEADLLIGACNYLDLDAFMAHLRGIEWEEPERVQVIVKEQDDDGFRILTLT
jgi:hypothetical protein